MRNLWIAGMAVVSLTSLVYAQTGQSSDAKKSWEEVFSRPTTCIDDTNAVRKVGDIASVAGMEFQCVETWGDGLKGLSMRWTRVTR